jgi:hypothetical protein
VFTIETKRFIICDMRRADEAELVTISQNEKYQRFYDKSDCNLDKYKELTHLFIQQPKDESRIAYQLAIEKKSVSLLVAFIYD